MDRMVEDRRLGLSYERKSKNQIKIYKRKSYKNKSLGVFLSHCVFSLFCIVLGLKGGVMLLDKASCLVYL